MSPTSRKYTWLALIALVVIVLDQGTKFLVLEHLTTAFDGSGAKLSVMYGRAPEAAFDGYHFRPKGQLVLSDDFFRLRYAENPGAAFGLFGNVPAEYRGPLFHLVSLGALLLVAHYVRKLKGEKNEVWARWGLPLVLGGAVGNYLDRLARSFVIDFLEAHWLERAYWPAFNVADTAIVIGVGLLLVDSFVREES
ncbi:MAG: signal peptidase II [Myxococcota bacterium]